MTTSQSPNISLCLIRIITIVNFHTTRPPRLVVLLQHTRTPKQFVLTRALVTPGFSLQLCYLHHCLHVCVWQTLCACAWVCAWHSAPATRCNAFQSLSQYTKTRHAATLRTTLHHMIAVLLPAVGIEPTSLYQRTFLRLRRKPYTTRLQKYLLNLNSFYQRWESNPRRGTKEPSYDGSLIPLGYRSTYQIRLVLR